jgi:hypothetical protein
VNPAEFDNFNEPLRSLDDTRRPDGGRFPVLEETPERISQSVRPMEFVDGNGGVLAMGEWVAVGLRMQPKAQARLGSLQPTVQYGMQPGSQVGWPEG